MKSLSFFAVLLAMGNKGLGFERQIGLVCIVDRGLNEVALHIDSL
jgi:hypothetical protein